MKIKYVCHECYGANGTPCEFWRAIDLPIYVPENLANPLFCPITGQQTLFKMTKKYRKLLKKEK